MDEDGWVVVAAVVVVQVQVRRRKLEISQWCRHKQAVFFQAWDPHVNRNVIGVPLCAC